MKREILLLLLLVCFYTAPAAAQSGCTGCEVVLPAGLPEDTIFLSTAPDGRVGQYYDGDLSFRLPKTTTPVNATDPDTPAGLTIDEITIISVTNLPPGLGWEANQTVFDPAEMTDGCVKFCGTPLQAGLYFVEVVVTAQIFVITETTTFSFPILIEPAVSNTDGFAMVNNTGCGSVLVAFDNNVPSGGADGFSYLWDFGNGTLSTEEDPADQLYDQPGLYPVSYQAVIDTTGYFLTRIEVSEVGCTDLLSAPDLKAEVIDPAGELVYISDVVDNAVTPLAFTLTLPLDTGAYQIKVTDADNGLGGADDDCGSVTFDRETAGTFANGDLSVSIDILHPVDTVRSADTVIVYPQPADPVLFGAPVGTICAGEEVLLETDYSAGLQWYRDSVPVLPGSDPELLVTEDGTFWVTHTSVDGCQAVSDQVAVFFEPLPAPPAFSNQNNELTLFDPEALPAEYVLQWYQEGEPLTGENDLTLCIPEGGTYTLEVTDLAAGCTNQFTQLVQYDPDFPNCVSDTDDLAEGSPSWRLYPNPTPGPLTLEGLTVDQEEVRWVLHDARGLFLQAGIGGNGVSGDRLHLDLSGYPAGLYWLELTVKGQRKTWKIVKR